MIDYFINYSHSSVPLILASVNTEKNLLLSGKYKDISCTDCSEQFSDLMSEAENTNNERLANAIFVVNEYSKLFCLVGEYYHLLDVRGYEESWDMLQNCFDTLRLISRFCENLYDLPEIERNLKSYEELYPFKLFFSPEYIISKSHCSLCGASMQNISCSHRKGELYWGKLAVEIVDEIKELQAVSLVEHPDNKRLVAKDADDKRPPEEKFKLLDYFLDLRISKTAIYDKKIYSVRNEIYKGVGRNEMCPCGSGEKYKTCCEKGFSRIEISNVRLMNLFYFEC